ncbi:MAG: PLP-dependent aminotransferase family protein [Desulfobacter sp.]|nr:MAG: PLP-dependent aminotransferase family protein [Desulfobacter sp.]
MGQAQVHIPENMIHLGLGQPGIDLLPLDLIQKASATLTAQKDASFLAYGAARGNPGIRQSLARFLTGHTPVGVDLSRLMVTNGNSQALDLICTLFSTPGDKVLVEAPTYFLALNIFADHGLTPVPLPMDEQGLIPAALEEAIKTNCPAFLYTIPFFHNPSSVTLSLERQEDLATISADHDLKLVSDEVYEFLYFDAPPPPSLGRYHDQCPVMALGSFSKILAPGLRLGWVHANAGILKKLSGAGLLRSGGGVNPLASAVVDQLIRQGDLAPHIKGLRQTFEQRCNALCRELKRVLPRTARFKTPLGGYFVWIQFPDTVDCRRLRPMAQARGVDFYPGCFFSPRGQFSSRMRLSFALYDETTLVQGAGRLGRAIQEVYPGLY